MKYIKLFENFEPKEIDLTNQYKSGNIKHKAEVGEVIKINTDTNWIRGEVFLTDNIIGYHGGLINNIDEYMNKTALYLTRSIGAALTWNKKNLAYTRVYEVKIKNGSKFIVGRGPAGLDYDGLDDEKKTLIPMGIVGMSDKNFKNNTHNDYGTYGSEGLVLDRGAIEEFRVVPFKELIQNEKVKKHLSEKNYKNFVNWYEQLKTQIFYTMEEYKEYEKSLEDPWLTHEIDFNSIPKISDKIDQTIENMDIEDLKALITSLTKQKKIYSDMFSVRAS